MLKCAKARANKVGTWTILAACSGVQKHSGFVRVSGIFGAGAGSRTAFGEKPSGCVRVPGKNRSPSGVTALHEVRIFAFSVARRMFH